MSLQQWAANAWLQRVERSSQEVSDLLEVAIREISDGGLTGISPDGKFNHAYDAVRTLCEIALHATGYKVPKGQNHHERTIASLRFTLGVEWGDEADYFDRCRRLRNKSTYDRSGVSSPRDADELLSAAQRLNEAVRRWLIDEHPDLM